MFSNLHTRRRIENRRRGAIMVKMAVLLPVLIGFMGLTIDGGFLLTTKRQAQNAADAAALAAAMDLMRGHPKETALATANQFVQQENGLSDATPLVLGTNFHVPPTTGPHAGKPNYVEVVVSTPHQSFFMHILTGAESSNVAARAVAGFEAVTAGEGVMVLDPNPKNGTGLTTGGEGVLKVEGRIVVNAEDPSAAAVPGKYGIIGHHIDVVGEVKDPHLFLPYDNGAPSPLRTGALPEPDPLLQLPIPTVGNGVDKTNRGEVSINNGKYTSSIAQGDINFTATKVQMVADGLHEATVGEVILHPGIYEEISINGKDSKVYMVPGIYVISPQKNGSSGFSINSGTIVGDNIMIYNTGKTYNPLDGSPDYSDGNSPPPSGNNNGFSGITFTDGIVKLSPINLKSLADKGTSHAEMYDGAPVVSSDFDGMLFFQRRHNREVIKITGLNKNEGAELAGTLYAKWALFDISGQGAYDAQFIAGSMSVTGGGDVTILGAGDKRGRANNVFLVE